jgi:hypothetical protein
MTVFSMWRAKFTVTVGEYEFFSFKKFRNLGFVWFLVKFILVTSDI